MLSSNRDGIYSRPELGKSVLFEVTIYCLAQGFSGDCKIQLIQERVLALPVTSMCIWSGSNKFIAGRSKDVYLHPIDLTAFRKGYL